MTKAFSKMDIKSYYHLVKPGIIYGNSIAAIAGFFLASKGSFDLRLFAAMLLGLGFIIGSSCVINNVIDADIDGKMQRTKNRSMVTGSISQKNALFFAGILAALGVYLLYFFTNVLTLSVALVGMISYVALYTPLKRKSVYGTLVGAVAGATPPVVGYVSVTNSLDIAAWILFLSLVFWQMPHFYAIAIRRLEDYREAGIPVLPLKRGIQQTKIQMIFYTIGFGVVASLLTYYKYTGYTYLVIVVILTFYWLWLQLRKNTDDKIWAKKVFLFSLVVLIVFSVSVPFGKFLP